MNVTFEQIFSIFRRALPYTLVGMIVLGLAGLAYSLVSPREYQATSRVIVDPRTRTLANQDVVSGLPPRDEAVVDTEVEFLESASVAARVVHDKKLISDPEFGSSSFEGATDNFSDALKIGRVGMTYLIDISVESRSPKRAAELANATAETYVLMQKESKRNATMSASQLLRKSADAKEIEVRDAEAAVERYRVSNNLLSVKGAPLAEQSAAQLADQLATARAQERAAIGELAAASSAPAALDSANAQASLGTLRAQQASAMQKMSSAATSYGTRHPYYLAAQQELARINEAVDAENTRARAAVSADRQQKVADIRARAAAATSMRQSLEASAGYNAAGLQRNSRASTSLADLERKAQALRQTYQTYLDRYQEVSSQLGTEQSDSNLVSAAAVPLRPHKPNLKMNVAIGLLTGLLGGISVATIMMLFESHFSTGTQIEEAFDLEALPSLPTAHSTNLTPSSKRIRPGEIAQLMLANPTDAFAEMHKNLLSALDRPVDGARNQVIAITSALPKEGKTTASVCLAAMAAHTGKRTLLVDCDQRRRGVTREMVGEPELGVRDAIHDVAGFRRMILRGQIENLDILPAANVASADIDVFNRDNMHPLLDALRQDYDLILLDTAPVLPIADTRILAPNADSVLFLCRWRHTSRKAVENALAILGKIDAPIAGIALTQVDLNQQAKFGYGDSLFYYKKYQDYYAPKG